MSSPWPERYGPDIYTEAPTDDDTLANLGPLRALAGVWEGQGTDTHPVADGTEEEPFIERYELEPIDPQTNGPQVLYGLRYHVHIVRPGEVETFHDQVGYWLWEPAAETVILTLTIPRGQVAIAGGSATADATAFEVTATAGDENYSFLSNPFLNDAFATVSFRMHVTVNSDGTWSYEEDTVLQIPGRPDPFHHTDRNTLTRVSAPTPNPRVGPAPTAASLGVGSLRQPAS